MSYIANSLKLAYYCSGSLPKVNFYGGANGAKLLSNVDESWMCGNACQIRLALISATVAGVGNNAIL